MLNQTLAGQRDGYELEKRYLTPDGVVVEARLATSLVRDDAGRPAYFISQVVDLTEINQARRQLAAANSMFEAMFDSAPVGKFVNRLNPDNTSEVVHCNRAFADMLGYTVKEILGTQAGDHVHPDDTWTRQHMIDQLKTHGTASVEARWLHRSGRVIWTQTSAAVTTTPDGETLFVLQTNDISERKRLEDRLRFLADHDPLTGLLTRRRPTEELDRELSSTGRHAQPGALLLIDLDGFKQVNDTHGHAAGDRLLVTIAGLLGDQLRSHDTIARLGGDEFAAILPDSSLEEAHRVAERIRDAIATTPVAASIGITIIDGSDDSDVDRALARADAAMYQAKAAGRGEVQLHESAQARTG